MLLKNVIITEKIRHKSLYTICLHFYDLLEKENYSDRIQFNGYQDLGMGWGMTVLGSWTPSLEGSPSEPLL